MESHNVIVINWYCDIVNWFLNFVSYSGTLINTVHFCSVELGPML